MTDTPTKRCAKCRLELPVDQFARDGRTRDQLTYRCHQCRTTRTANQEDL